MNDPTQNDDLQQRLLELLSDRALFGLEPDEQAELETLQTRFPEIGNDEMDRVVALLETGSPNRSSAMPSKVKDEILRTAGQHSDLKKREKTSTSTSTRSTLDSGSRSSISAFGRRDLMVSLLTMAATGLIAALTFWSPKKGTPIAMQRKQFLQRAGKVVQAKWTSETAAGDVVWSNKLQEGYMTFSGLPVNNPTVEQYQLWIFQEDPLEDHPVDGGVFDIAGGDATVKIDAKLKIKKKPTAFAITIEKPGGVVVSGRKRLPAIAQPE